VIYESVRIETGFHANLLVENKVIVEIKSVETIAPVHKKQLLSYLKLADKRLGLLINFNVVLIKNGITRIVNQLKECSLAKTLRPPRRVRREAPERPTELPPKGHRYGRRNESFVLVSVVPPGRLLLTPDS
jgi:hypothetical protein